MKRKFHAQFLGGCGRVNRLHLPGAAMKQSSAREKWLHDISWNWSGSSSTHGKAGSRDKFQSLTLTMTHNPTHISVTKSTSPVPNKRDKIAQLRSNLWSGLLLAPVYELAELFLCKSFQIRILFDCETMP